MPQKLDLEKLSHRAHELYEAIPEDHSVGNNSLMSRLEMSKEEYRNAQKELLEAGLIRKGKGRGGSVTRFPADLAHKGTSRAPALEQKKNDLSEKAKTIMNLIPEDGSFVTNQRLRYKLRPSGFSTEDFWKYRKELLDNNLIQVKRGRGGSVAIGSEYVEEKHVRAPKGILVKDEDKLYDGLRNWLDKNQVAETEQSGGQAWAVVTGKPGQWKRRSGHWSRPDVTLVAVTTYEFLPHQRDMEVTTYEIKKYQPQIDNTWVFEAASHSKGANYSYLVVETTEEKRTEEPPSELLSDLQQFGIGFGWLYLNSETKEYEFYEVFEPERKIPVPEDENSLLKQYYNKLKPGEQTAFKHAIGRT